MNGYLTCIFTFTIFSFVLFEFDVKSTKKAKRNRDVIFLLDGVKKLGYSSTALTEEPKGRWQISSLRVLFTAAPTFDVKLNYNNEPLKCIKKLRFVWNYRYDPDTVVDLAIFQIHVRRAVRRLCTYAFTPLRWEARKGEYLKFLLVHPPSTPSFTSTTHTNPLRGELPHYVTKL